MEVLFSNIILERFKCLDDDTDAKKRLESECLEKVANYAGKRINSKPISIAEIIDDGSRSAMLQFTFASGKSFYKMVYDYGFGGEQFAPIIRKIK